MRRREKEPFPRDYTEQIEVTKAMRRAFLNFRHFKKLDKKAVPFIEKELPGYIVMLSKGDYREGIEVWRRNSNERITYTWPRSLAIEPEDWKAQLELELQRNDYSDYAERQAMEVTLVPKLDEIKAKIHALQAKSRALFAGLPRPASAKIRDWKYDKGEASYELRSNYPEIFENSGKDD